MAVDENLEHAMHLAILSVSPEMWSSNSIKKSWHLAEITTSVPLQRT